MNTLQSIVYVLSRFTPEALFFESLGILALLAGYTAFWINKKRKFGVIKQDVPAPLVKTYLNELIVDAENMRVQLFGLLSKAGVPAGTGVAIAADPNAAARIAALEAKLAEQSRAIDGFASEKARIEQELNAARSQAGDASGAESAVAVAQLKEKVQSLEGRLAEYSVIEDDLANLKRLQQENQQLKAQVGGGVAVAAAATGAVAAAAPAPAPTPAPVVAAPAPAPAPVAAAPAPAAAPAAPAAATGDAIFEGLVDSVEKSLEKPATPAPVAAAPAPATPAPATPAAPAEAAANQSDADLVAEFEKMLNG